MINFKLLTRYEQKTNLPNITPLVDLIFNLLLFFLLTYAVTSPALQVALPAAASGQVTKSAGVQITVTRDGTLFLQGQSFKQEELAVALSQELAKQHTQEVLVSAAKELPFEKVVQVMDLAEQAGASQLALAVEPAGGARVNVYSPASGEAANEASGKRAITSVPPPADTNP